MRYLPPHEMIWKVMSTDWDDSNEYRLFFDSMSLLESRIDIKAPRLTFWKIDGDDLPEVHIEVKPRLDFKKECRENKTHFPCLVPGYFCQTLEKFLQLRYFIFSSSCQILSVFNFSASSLPL